jgi:hypothetical protein
VRIGTFHVHHDAEDGVRSSGPGVAEGSESRALIIPLIIQTIRRDPSRPVAIDEAPNVSRAEPSGPDQTDAEHQATDLAVGRHSLVFSTHVRTWRRQSTESYSQSGSRTGR